MGEVGVEELSRDRKDEAGLNEAGWFQWRVVEEIGKGEARDRVREGRHWLLYSVAREIDPLEEVGDLWILGP